MNVLRLDILERLDAQVVINVRLITIKRRIYFKMDMQEEHEYDKLKQENSELRNSLDNCFPIDKVENEDIWEKIGFLIDNEIEMEKFCNQ